MRHSYRILFAKKVAADLDVIFEHIAQDSPRNAAAFIGRILDAMAQLRTFPHRTIVDGQNLNAPNPVRLLPVESYIVFFRVVEEHHIVRIIHVRHGARRRPRRFR